MGFDAMFDDFDSNVPKAVDTIPAIVKETIEYGAALVNHDYLPKIENIAKLKPFLKDYKELNLYKLGWKFQFGSSRQWVGLCSVAKNGIGKSENKNIYVSINFVKHDLNWKAGMKDTILHEIAHAIVMEIFYFNKKNGVAALNEIDEQHNMTGSHGLVFDAVCSAISDTNCSVTYKDANLKDSFKKYKYDCAACEHTGYGDYRKFTNQCEKCGKSVICEANNV